MNHAPSARRIAQVFPIVIGLLLLSSCQLYRSGGRALFESNSPGQITNTTLTSQEHVGEQASSCWAQPANEPLWFTQAGEKYTITPTAPLNMTSNNDAIIEVCRDDSNADQGTGQ